MYYTQQQKKILLELARNTIKAVLEGTLKYKKIVEIPEWLRNRLACFVTLHTKDGELRGCIGNMIAFESLYENIMHNAINSAFKDPRFIPLSSLKELDVLVIEISILTQMVKVSSHRDIVLGKHGIHLAYGESSSVFLPQVPIEQNWTLEETLNHLCIKAGLGQYTWKLSPVSFEVFEAIIIGE